MKLLISEAMNGILAIHSIFIFLLSIKWFIPCVFNWWCDGNGKLPVPGHPTNLD